jgi:antitoxin CptB
MCKPSPNLMDGAASATFSDVARERLGILEWRCRRGMKELDFLLLRYLKRHALATSDELAAFAEFLELPDPDIAGYLLAGDVPSDPRHAALCRELLTN